MVDIIVMERSLLDYFRPGEAFSCIEVLCPLRYSPEDPPFCCRWDSDVFTWIRRDRQLRPVPLERAAPGVACVEDDMFKVAKALARCPQ